MASIFSQLKSLPGLTERENRPYIAATLGKKERNMRENVT